MLRLLAALLLVLQPLAARADDCSGPGHVRLVAEADEDRETLAALQALLPRSDDASPTWVITITGLRTVVQHRDGDLFARSLEASSTAYARASAAAELLTAARAAVCPAETSEAPSTAPPSPSTVLSVGLGARFDADVDGPWLLRPTAFAEIAVVLSGTFALLVGLEAHVLGFYERSTQPPAFTVRYERHDVVASLGVGLRVGPLTFSGRLLGGVSIRDVTALGDAGALANRLDVSPTVGGALGLRIPLVGPLGLRLAADLVGVPQTFTYRTLGVELVREQPLRIGAEAAFDLAW